jgi:hypothetical protein
MIRHTKKLVATLGVALLLSVSAAAARDLVMEHINRKITSQLARCFKAPPNAVPPYPSVTLLINFKPDGIVEGAPQIVSQLDGSSSAVALAVVRAARCVRIDDFYNFQKDYPRWKSTRVLFDPNLKRQ